MVIFEILLFCARGQRRKEQNTETTRGMLCDANAAHSRAKVFSLGWQPLSRQAFHTFGIGAHAILMSRDGPYTALAPKGMLHCEGFG
ncbi:hypothetical protein [Desulfovibrio sp. MES5]|uniref:hypothetical protein n=1 Tax=Desulfovibrio sp. MES5 TaxID=1899016 RepID=UPI0025C52E83|nr:hypothetical protein [Desulfovibrio sp. MES5]